MECWLPNIRPIIKIFKNFSPPSKSMLISNESFAPLNFFCIRLSKHDQIENDEMGQRPEFP